MFTAVEAAYPTVNCGICIKTTLIRYWMISTTLAISFPCTHVHILPCMALPKARCGVKMIIKGRHFSLQYCWYLYSPARKVWGVYGTGICVSPAWEVQYINQVTCAWDHMLFGESSHVQTWLTELPKRVVQMAK